jgi:hypothetical protein
MLSRIIVLAAALLILPACGSTPTTDDPTPIACPAGRVCGATWSLVPPPDALPVRSRVSAPYEVVTLRGMTVTSSPYDGTLQEYVQEVVLPMGDVVLDYHPVELAGAKGLVVVMVRSTRYVAFHAGRLVAIEFDADYDERVMVMSVATLAVE